MGCVNLCGTAGVICLEHKTNGNGTHVSFELVRILQDLQNRGPDTAGITVLGDSEPKTHKDEGPVSSVFSERILSELKGSSGVGHTRYKTIGAGGKKNAQPFSVSFNHGRDQIHVAMSHNGHVINYEHIKNALGKCDIPELSALSSDCDVEPILHLFAHYLAKLEGSPKEKIYGAAKKVMGKVVGAYSVSSVVDINGQRLFVAMRDPRGIRPFVLGKKDSSIAAASESVALMANDYGDINDLKPGEVVVVDKDLNLESRVVLERARKFCVFDPIYFGRASSVMEGIDNNAIRYEFGRQLGRENYLLKEELDIVTYVPFTPLPAALGFAKYLGVEFKEILEKERSAGRNFLKPTQQIREIDTARNIQIVGGVTGKTIGLVDDSIVRGTTSRDVIRKLKRAGAKGVYLLIASPPTMHPCNWGINTPTYEELIAVNKSLEEIRHAVGADKLAYLSMDGLKTALAGYGDTSRIKYLIDTGVLSPEILERRPKTNEFCYACMDGNRPTREEEQNLDVVLD